MSAAVDKVISALDAHGCRPKRSRKGWSARCPAHEDNSPSLSVSEGAEGRVLLRCHAGCGADAITRALGLEERDLFDKRAGRRGTGSRSTRRTVKATRPAAKASNAEPPKTFATWQEALPRSLGEPSHVAKYQDADGQLVGVVARFEPKTFRQASVAPGGGWLKQAMLEPRKLYNLPATLASDGVIVVVEGERCADVLASLGTTATTSPGGAKAAAQADWSPLAGRRVVILPDHDEAGEGYAADVARLAADAGAESVSLVRLSDHWPACPPKGDVADWIESFGDAAEPCGIRAALEQMLAAAEPVAAEAVEPAANEDDLTWTPFPTGELPEPLASFVRETAEATGADESMVALPLLAMVAGAIGNARRLSPKASWRIPPILWTATVAEPGSGKSPAFRAATQFTDHAQSQAFARHELAMADYERRLQDHEIEVRRAATKGGNPPGQKPEKPVARRFLVNDITMEALISVLKGNERGVVVAVDELAGWFAAHDAYRAGGRCGLDRPKWLSMFDAGPVTVDRKTSGTVHIPSAAVSITGAVQGRILRGLLTDENVASGLVSRFVFAMPPRRPMRWSETSASFALVDEVASLFQMLLDGAIGRDVRTDGPKDLDLDPDAKAEFRRFAEETYAAASEASGAVAGMLSKLTALAGRFALVIHLARQAGREPTLGDRVGVESVRRGVALASWAGREQRRIYSLLLDGRGVDEAADDAERLRRWLEARGGVASMRDVRRGLARFHDEERTDAAVARLVAECRAVRNAAATGGRPAQVVRLVGAAAPPADAVA